MNPIEQTPGQSLRTLQIIATAMLLGPVIFLGIVVVLISQGSVQKIPEEVGTILTYLAIALMVVGGTLSNVLPPLIVRSVLAKLKAIDALQNNSSEKPAPSRVVMAIQSGFLIGQALAEAPTIFALIVYLLVQQPLLLGLAILGLILQLIRFPTQDWLRRQVEYWERELLRESS